MKVILTKGLPGSGKSTWAKKLIDDNPNTYKRINKDDLRAMMDNGKFSRDAEKFVLSVRDTLILNALQNGKHVIVDDTNLHPKHEDHIRNLVKGLAEVEVKDFTSVPLEECIKRDLTRFHSVGERVIKQMHNQFLVKKEHYVENTNLPHSIVVDLDGTLALNNSGRSPYEWGRVKEDALNTVIANIVMLMENWYIIIILSGRDEICRNDTMKWLEQHRIPYDHLYMRPQSNTEKDSIIKRRLFEENIRGRFYVAFVIDDRNQVVEMWRNMGLTCLQVADGDF